MRRGSGAGRVPLPALLVLLLAVAAAAGAGEEEPLLARRQGRLELVALPDILSPEEVREHLRSGLTTTFVLRATVRDGRRRTVSRGLLAIRYDLWEEVFEVTSSGFLGRRRWREASFEELAARWRSPPAAELPVDGLDRAGPWRVRITVDLIPFSSREQQDTQRWLADALGGAGRGASGGVEESAEEGPEPVTSLLNLLAATSVQRDPLISWRWTVEVAAP